MGILNNFVRVSSRLLLCSALVASVASLAGCKATAPPNPEIAAANKQWLSEKIQSAVKSGLGDKNSWRIYKSCVGDTNSWLVGCYVDNYYGAGFSASKLSAPVEDFCQKAFTFLENLQPTLVTQISSPEYGVKDTKSGLKVCLSEKNVVIMARQDGRGGTGVWNMTIQNEIGNESIGIDLRMIGAQK